MGVLQNMKDVVRVAQEFGATEFKQQILNLQAEVQELFQENLELKETLRAVEAERRTEAELHYDQGLYWKNGETGIEEGPYCSRCWDVERRLVRAHDYRNGYFICPKCDTSVQHPRSRRG